MVAAHAQTSQTTGAIRGIIRAKKSGVVAGAAISVRNTESGFTRTVITDAGGAYLLSFIPVGPYEVTVVANRLKTAKNNNLRVALGEAKTLNFDLDSAEASATVEVTASSSAVDATAVNTSASISQELIEAVPLNGRNFTDLVQLTPGAPPNAQGYRTSVEGARGIGNNLMIDGASFNSKFNGEARGGTRIPFAFGLDSIRELQVITNPFDVQYGDASGGVINAITKSGTNTVSGGIFTQIRPDSLVAKIKPVSYDPNGTTNTVTARTRAFSQSEFGFNLGGPIIKDKLHYFVNVDTVHYSQQSVPTLTTSDGTTTASTAFATFWGANGMGSKVSGANSGANLLQESTSPWTDDFKHTTVMGRLDWTINENHRASLRINTQNYKGENDIYSGSIKNNVAESNNSALNYKSNSYVGELSSVLSPNLLNEFRVQYSTEDRPEVPNSSVSPELGLPGFTAGNYYIDPRNTIENTTQIIDNLSLISGDWTLKAGIDYQKLNYSNTFFQYGRGAWYFKTWDTANQWFSGNVTNPNTLQYQQAWSNSNGQVDFGEKILASYLSAQYSGFMNKRLTLTGGLRYTREMYGRNPSPNPKVQGLDQMPDNGALDPRIGFSLDLFGDNRTVVRGGIGLFSVTNPAQNVASAFLQNGQNSLPYKISYNSNNANLFQPGGILSATSRINSSGHVTALDPSLLASAFSAYPGTINVTLMDPQAHMAQSRNMLLGIEHDLGNGYVVKARGVYKKFTHLQYFMDINMGQINPASNSTNPSIFYNDGYPFQNNMFSNSASSVTPRPGHAVVRGRSLDLTGYGSVGLSKFDGTGSYEAFIMELERRPSANGLGFMTNVTLSKSRDTNSNERSTAQSAASNPVDPSNPLAEARSDNDIPVRFVFMGYMPTFYGVKSSVIFTYSSGYAFTPRYNADMNNDGYSNDPYTGGRNSMRQPYMKTMNLKVSRVFPLMDKVKLEGVVEVYNLFNWANQTTTYLTADAAPDVNGVNPFRQLSGTDKKTREVQFTLKATF